MIIGGGRYIVEQPGKAEIAFAVVDEYQGQGIGAALMRHLSGIAREAGLERVNGGGTAGQHFDAEGLREERIAP